jgi:hypothetical protein
MMVASVPPQRNLRPGPIRRWGKHIRILYRNGNGDGARAGQGHDAANAQGPIIRILATKRC